MVPENSFDVSCPKYGKFNLVGGNGRKMEWTPLVVVITMRHSLIYLLEQRNFQGY